MVYFIAEENPEDFEVAYRIGKFKNEGEFSRKFNRLQTGNHRNLQILFSVEMSKTEYESFREFQKNQKIRASWFLTESVNTLYMRVMEFLNAKPSEFKIGDDFFLDSNYMLNNKNHEKRNRCTTERAK